MAHSEQKVAATLAALRANGGNVKRTSRETGVGESTIRNWRDRASTNGERQEAIEQQTEATAEAMGDILEGFIRKIFSDGLTDQKIKAAPLDKLILAAAVAIDKMRLLRGEPTDINEQRGLSVLQQFNRQMGDN